MTNWTKAIVVITLAIVTAAPAFTHAARVGEHEQSCALAHVGKTIQYLNRKEVAANKGLALWKGRSQLEGDAWEVEEARRRVQKWKVPLTMAAGLLGSMLSRTIWTFVATIPITRAQQREPEVERPPLGRDSRNVFSTYVLMHQHLSEAMKQHQLGSGKDAAFWDELFIGHDSAKALKAAVVEAEVHRALYEEELTFIKILRKRLQEAQRKGRCDSIPEGISITMEKNLPVISLAHDIPPLEQLSISGAGR